MMQQRVQVLCQLLVDSRKRLGLTQEQAAARLAVTRSLLAMWECERASIPRKYLAVLANLYGLDVAELETLHEVQREGARSPGDLPRLPGSATGQLPYEVNGTLEAMLTYGPVARRLHLELRERLGPACYQGFLFNFPRDSALELLKAHRLMCAGESRLRTLRPLKHLGWLFPMVERESDRLVAHRPHYAIQVTDGDLRLTAVPQVTLLTRRITDCARLDFLAQVSDGNASGFLDLEVDGNHEGSFEKDQQRAIGLGLVRVAFTREDILHPNYDERIWQRLRGTLNWLKSRDRCQSRRG